jgi:hypothetical protein
MQEVVIASSKSGGSDENRTEKTGEMRPAWMASRLETDAQIDGVFC